MAVRDANSQWDLQDRTDTINEIENQYGLLTQLGIFDKKGVTTKTFQYDQTEDGFGLIEDRPWGAKRDQFAGKQKSKTHAFPLPHFPYDGHVKPSDVAGKRAVGTDNEFDTLDLAVARELKRIHGDWGQTKEWAHRTAIVEGKVYAPNGTVDVDFYRDLGVTRKTVAYTLGTPTTQVQEKGEEVVGHIQDNMKDGTIVSDIIALCSPKFFSGLVRHPKYEQAYASFNASNSNGNILRDRLGVVNGKFRTFRGGDDILYIEYRGVMKGQQIIPDGEAYALPLDASGETFKTIFAPMEHTKYVNTEGQEMYAFEYELERGQGWDIESESNFADFVFRPQCIVKLTHA